MLQKQVDATSLANKATLDQHSRAFQRKVKKKMLSVQVVRLSVKVCYLHLYTIQLQSFSYVSVKFEAAVRFYKDTGAHQRRLVDEKWLPLSTDQFQSDCL